MNLMARYSRTKEFIAQRATNWNGDHFENDLDKDQVFAMSLIEKWMNSGSKTFMVSQELLEAFRFTAISERTTHADFKLPFETFMLDGEPLWKSTIYNGHETEERAIHNLLYISVEGHPILLSIYPYEDILGFYFYGFKPDATIKAYDALTMMSDSEGAVTKTNPASHEDYIGKLQNVFYNTVYYITDPSRSIAETEIESVQNSAGYWQINKEKRTSRQHPYIMLRPPNYYHKLPGDDQIRRIGVRFMVRGHWRNQAMGVDFSEHHLVWIAPHWKGPEFGDVVTKPYKVK